MVFSNFLLLDDCNSHSNIRLWTVVSKSLGLLYLLYNLQPLLNCSGLHLKCSLVVRHKLMSELVAVAHHLICLGERRRRR